MNNKILILIETCKFHTIYGAMHIPLGTKVIRDRNFIAVPMLAYGMLGTKKISNTRRNYISAEQEVELDRREHKLAKKSKRENILSLSMAG